MARVGKRKNSTRAKRNTNRGHWMCKPHKKDGNSNSLSQPKYRASETARLQLYE